MKAMRLLLFISFVVITCGLSAQWKAPLLQQDPLVQTADSPVQKWNLSRPQKASLYSAILPGSGQIYNRKYWKAGVVYAGTAGLIYMFKSNVDSLRDYQYAYEVRLDGDSTTEDLVYTFLSDAAVKSYRDYHRRLRDVSILGFVGLYALQIIDANVDAHLYEFRVNEDLSMRVEPVIRPLGLYQNAYHGLRLSFQF